MTQETEYRLPEWGQSLEDGARLLDSSQVWLQGPAPHNQVALARPLPPRETEARIQNSQPRLEGGRVPRASSGPHREALQPSSKVIPLCPRTKKMTKLQLQQSWKPPGSHDRTLKADPAMGTSEQEFRVRSRSGSGFSLGLGLWFCLNLDQSSDRPCLASCSQSLDAR